jgi:hypothetical protein
MTSNKTHTKYQETIYIKRQTEMASLELLHKPWLHLARVLQFIMQAALLLIKMGTTGILPIVEFMNINVWLSIVAHSKRSLPPVLLW